MADINEFNNEMNEVVSGVEPVKKRTGAVVGGIAAGVVAVAVGGGIAAYNLSDFVKNQVKLRISKPENYYTWVTERNSSELAAQIADSYRTAIEERKNGQHAQLSLKYEASDELRNMLLEETGTSESNIAIIENLKEIKLGIDAMSKDKIMSGNVYVEQNGESLINLEMAADSQALDMFFRLPALSDQWMTASEAIGEAEVSEMAVTDPESIITPEELEQLVVKYVDLYNSLITDIEIEKKEEVAIGDINVNYTVAEMTVTEKQFCEIAAEFVTAVKEDELIKSIMVDRTKSMTAEEYYEALDNDLSKVQHDESYEYSDKTATFKTYIDPNGDIRGISFENSEENSLRFIVGRDGDEVRGEAFVTNEGEEDFRADLTMTDNDDVYSGNLAMVSDGEQVSVEFTELSVADEKKGYVNGGISVTTPDEQSFVLALMSDGSSQQIAADIVVEDVNYGKLTVEIASENGAEPTVPDKSGAFDVTAEDVSFPIDYVEQDKFTAYIKDTFLKLGMSEAEAQEYAESLTDGMYMTYDDIYDDWDYEDYNGWDDDEDMDVDEEDIDVDDEDLFFEGIEDDPYAADAVEAEDGQAYITVMDSSLTSFYMGGGQGENLSYGAKVADIKGDGTYTIGVTADTDGYKNAAGDTELPDGLYVLGICGSGIDGIDNADITVKSVKIDGKEYLDSESFDISAFDDTFDLVLYTDGVESLIDGSSVGEWTDIEITFEIKGLK